MLIPSIDLQGGRIVQLVGGRRLAVASDDLDGWIARFKPFPLVQVIDLDAAMNRHGHDDLLGRLCRELPCQVGGGVRSVQRAQTLLDAGAHRVIVGSALFADYSVALGRAREFADAVGPDRLVAAVDARGGFVTVHGWTDTLPITPINAIEALAPYVGAFLYTHVDTEGTMSGLDVQTVLALRRATDRQLIAAGGVRSVAEIEHLDSLGIDAVVGMAIYTGRIDLEAVVRGIRRPGNADPPTSV